MSLQLCKYFVSAFRASEEVLSATSGRIFFAGRDMVQEEQDKVPYITLTPTGINVEGVKDNLALEDDCGVDALVVAETAEGIMELADAVRQAVAEASVDTSAWGFRISKPPVFSCGEVQYDMVKPCYYQMLHWQTRTMRFQA